MAEKVVLWIKSIDLRERKVPGKSNKSAARRKRESGGGESHGLAEVLVNVSFW